MAYAQQPQNILAVIYDGCIIFKRTVWRVWPLGIALFLLNLWLVMSYLIGFAYHSEFLPEQSEQILWHYLLYPSHLNVHQLPFFINSVLSALVGYLMIAMVWAAIDDFIKHGTIVWSNVLKRLVHRGLALLLQWVIMVVLVAFGYVLLVLPAVIMYVLFYQARFYVFLEGFGAFRSFVESAQLVWGTSWWRTFFLFALIFSCSIGFFYAISLLRMHLGSVETYIEYLAYAGMAVVSVVLEILFASWQLALFNDLKLRWVLPSAEGSGQDSSAA